ncbi:DUF3768 domain-containing protein [Rubrimonas cliftonensis]|uniref:DUF3768 domain-containing protein n=1 Tax=Rubrimonas cliftonensis TaxID=89524 RepID=A0A1H4ER71_9RHOB|nr:DUF3768 domain-containing protein [Rubrimonas cliftonensis]SEA87407.1 Protein of unknown function [Rubrimonas cliftonensis]
MPPSSRTAPHAAAIPGAPPHATLAEQNDAFRRALGQHPAYPGQLVVTQGVMALDAPRVFRLMQAVARHAEFPEDDDPNGEHEFGAIEHDGAKWFFKIDYFENADCEYGAEEPLDPARCHRVLTVMRADEY